MRGSNGQLTQSGIWCGQHEAQQGQLTRSLRREYGCGNRGRATSWRRMTVTPMTMGLNSLNNRPWWGAKREKLNVQRFVFAIATKRSVANCFDRSWAYFLVRFWGFEARTKNEYTMDDFATLTIREPWLLKKKNSTSTVSTWLAVKELMLQSCRDSRPGTKSTEISNRPLQRKGSYRQSSIISCTRKMTSSGNFKE
jgi:hypothetical protein